MLDLHQEVVDGDGRVQLFVNFPDDGFLRRFSRFDFAAREFPAAFEFAIATLRGEDLVIFDDDCGNDVDGFHEGPVC